MSELQKINPYQLYLEKSEKLDKLLHSLWIRIEWKEHQTLQHTYYTIEAVTWSPTEENKNILNKHLVEIEQVPTDHLSDNQRDLLWHAYFAPQNIKKLRELLDIPRKEKN